MRFSVFCFLLCLFLAGCGNTPTLPDQGKESSPPETQSTQDSSSDLTTVFFDTAISRTRFSLTNDNLYIPSILTSGCTRTISGSQVLCTTNTTTDTTTYSYTPNIQSSLIQNTRTPSGLYGPFGGETVLTTISNTLGGNRHAALLSFGQSGILSRQLEFFPLFSSLDLNTIIGTVGASENRPYNKIIVYDIATNESRVLYPNDFDFVRYDGIRLIRNRKNTDETYETIAYDMSTQSLLGSEPKNLTNILTDEYAIVRSGNAFLIAENKEPIEKIRKERKPKNE